jgi:hypothetical protein
VNTKENVLCEERKEEKIKRRCWRVQILREVEMGGPLRCSVRSTSEFSAREKEEDGGMMTRMDSAQRGVWAATNERRWLCDSFWCVCEGETLCLLLPLAVNSL